MNRMVIFLCLVLTGASFFCSAQTTKSTYAIANRYAITGDGGWDYVAVDENTSRLFISHGLVTQVMDCTSGKLLGTIANTIGVHGIAIDQDDNKAFITCGRDSTVSIVDLTTLAFIKKVKVTGVGPDAILYDAFSEKVFVYNGRTSNATVIDAKSNEVVATIPLDGKPEFSVTDGNGKVYVNIEDKSEIAVIDSKELTVVNVWPIAPGEEPSGLAIDKVTHRLFSVCSNKKMVVLNAVTGKVVTTLDIGDKVDGCAFDPGLKRAYSSNGEGTMTVVQQSKGDKYSVLTTVPTNEGARTIACDSQTHHLYLPYAEYGPAPAPTATNPHPRPTVKPGTFMIIDVAPN